MTKGTIRFGTRIGNGAGMGEAAEFPVGRIAATAALVGITFAAVDVAKELVSRKVLGKKGIPDFDVVIDGNPEKGFKMTVRDVLTVEEEKEAIKEARSAVKAAKKDLKDADDKAEKAAAKAALKEAEKELAALLNPDAEPEADTKDEKDEEDAA